MSSVPGGSGEPELSFARLAPADLEFLVSVRNECRDFLHDDRAFTVQEAEQWFRESRPDFYVISLRPTGTRIGYFRVSNHDRASRSAYVGADLAPAFRGMGLGEQSYRAFLPWLAGRYALDVVRLEVLSHNRRARALYDKLGFVEIDRVEGFDVRNGEVVDSIVMQLRL